MSVTSMEIYKKDENEEGRCGGYGMGGEKFFREKIREKMAMNEIFGTSERLENCGEMHKSRFNLGEMNIESKF